MRLLITGANGFVGRAIAARVEREGVHGCRCVVRRKTDSILSHQDVFVSGNLEHSILPLEVFEGVDVVIHTAARVHMMHETAMDPLAEFRKVNVEGTIRLAQEAADAGVRRFVFISSIKVNGEQTHERPFQAEDIPSPEDAYGLSKYEAEKALFVLAEKTGMQVTIVRPPLVYGPGVRANFQKMINWIERGLPLPFGRIQNKRSLVALDNLVDFILTCAEREKAANQVFLVSDGQAVSTPDLARCIGDALGRPAKLLPFPENLLTGFAKLLGKGDVANRILGSLDVDITKNEVLLGWRPIVSMQDQLVTTVEAYRCEKAA